jgi:hypothetical protein
MNSHGFVPQTPQQRRPLPTTHTNQGIEPSPSTSRRWNHHSRRSAARRTSCCFANCRSHPVTPTHTSSARRWQCRRRAATAGRLPCFFRQQGPQRCRAHRRRRRRDAARRRRCPARARQRPEHLLQHRRVEMPPRAAAGLLSLPVPVRHHVAGAAPAVACVWRREHESLVR